MERAGDAVTGVIGPVFVSLASCLLTLGLFTFCEPHSLNLLHILSEGFAFSRSYSPDTPCAVTLHTSLCTPGGESRVTLLLGLHNTSRLVGRS